MDGSEGTRTISVGHGYKCGYTLIGLSGVEGCTMRLKNTLNRRVVVCDRLLKASCVLISYAMGSG